MYIARWLLSSSLALALAFALLGPACNERPVTSVDSLPNQAADDGTPASPEVDAGGVDDASTD
jgi:hypothetical protein